MDKNTGYTLPVYVLTRTGNNINEEGVKVVNDMVLGNENEEIGFDAKKCERIRNELPEGTTGILIHHGPDLLDAGYLADLLEKDMNARVVISFVDHFAVCPYGPSETDGIRNVIHNLRIAAKAGVDSWTVINDAPHSHEEYEEMLRNFKSGE